MARLKKKNKNQLESRYFQWATFKGGLVSRSFPFPSFGDEIELKQR